VRFEGKVAIITGAAGGIGSAAAALFAKDGCRVAALDINEPALEALAEKTDGLPGVVTPVLADAFDPDDVTRSVTAVLGWTGKVDILVNCVGGSTIIPSTGRPVEELSLEEWKKLLDFNLDSTFLFCKEVLPQMKSQGFGKIVNMSSRAATGLGGSPAAYAAAKAGIIAMTTRIANEAGPYGVNVNAVAPDTTLTDRILNELWLAKSEEDKQAYLNSVALRRMGQPEDQAKVIAFLASEDADYISGQTIHVNGGM
jgi:NAD(P)-dependent dehydrogenase (short-subunit alcohol dehydrogenase family)